MLLEKQLLHKLSRESKKRKESASPRDDIQALYTQLAKLYRALDESDVLRGIFEKEIARHPYTKQALDAELKGDYVEALQIYEEATHHLDEGKPWEGVAPTAQEEEHWENGRLECLVNLTRWNDLAENT